MCLKIKVPMSIYESIVSIANENPKITLLTKEHEVTTRIHTTKVKFICVCGKETTKSCRYFIQKPLCKSCSHIQGTSGVDAETFFETLRKEFEQEGYELLSTNYTNAMTPLSFKCPEGHLRETTANRFRNGHRCKDCDSKARTNFSKIQTKFDKLGMTLYTTEKEYKNKNMELHFKCTCGNDSTVTWSTAFNEGWKCCKDCVVQRTRHAQEYVEAYFERFDCKLLSIYKNNSKRLYFECPCGNYGYTSFKSFRAGARCPHCTRYKREETNMLIYGCKNPFQNEDIKIKARATCKKRYGVEHIMQRPDVVLKTKQTNMEIYGAMYKFVTDEVKEKGRQVTKELYGVEYPFQNPEIKEKSVSTFMKNYYGEDYEFATDEVKIKYPLQSAKFREKAVSTHLERYGVTSPFLVKERFEEFVEKRRNTCMVRYGVTNPMQDAAIFDKNMKASFRRKEFIFPSGKKVFVQGYEPYCLQELIDEGIDEDDIITGCKNIPTIKYMHPRTNRTHVYFPDIYIKSKDLLIEVKSYYTYNLHADINESKFEESCKHHKFQLRIYGPDATLLEYRDYLPLVD